MRVKITGWVTHIRSYLVNWQKIVKMKNVNYKNRVDTSTMPKPPKCFIKFDIDHYIKQLNQIKLVIISQYKLLKTLTNVKSNISNEIKANTQSYLDIFKDFDLEYYQFIQEHEKQNKVQQHSRIQQVKESYTSLQLFKDELVNGRVNSNIVLEIDTTDENDIEMSIAHRNNSKPSFWKKLFSCTCNAEKDDRLIEITEHTGYSKPSL